MQENSSYDDKLLFEQIARGDETAFTQLFNNYAPRLLSFLRKITHSEEQARELVQETFLQIWVKRGNLTSVEQPMAWIYRVASNLSLTYLRNEGNRRRIMQMQFAGRPEATDLPQLETKELHLIIRRAVETLPAKRQEIYRMSREEGLTHQQIADRLGISLQTVKNQIGSALKIIQEHIGRETGLSIATLMVLFGL